MADARETTAELVAHVNTVSEQCTEAIRGFDSKLDLINKKYDDRLDEIDKRMDNQSDEINREMPKQMAELRGLLRETMLIQGQHTKDLSESADNKKFFGRAAITAIFTLITGALAAWGSASGWFKS